MPGMLKPAAVLFVVTLLAAFALGVGYDITKGPIADRKALMEEATVAVLLPGTDGTESITIEEGMVTKVVTCFAEGQTIGYAISCVPKGYEGTVEVMVGYDTSGVIQGIQLLSHAETPGLGANAALPGFTNQFKGKSGSLKVTKVKGSLKEDEVEAVTSATITSNAVVSGVNAATAYFENHLLK